MIYTASQYWYTLYLTRFYLFFSMTDQGGPGGLRVKQRQQVPVGVRRRQQETGRLRGTQRIHAWKTVSFISVLICSYLATSYTDSN